MKPAGGVGPDEPMLMRVTPGWVMVEKVTVTGRAPLMGSTGTAVMPPAS